MGRVADVLVKLDGHCQPAQVHLDSEVLTVQLDPRVTVRLSEISDCRVEDGWLGIRYGNQELELHLGAAAGRWQKAIESPPTLLDKLGIKPGVPTAAIGFSGSTLFTEAGCDVTLVEGTLYDLVILHAPDLHALDQICPLRRWISPRGGLWVVYPRGSKEIPERAVRAEAVTDDWVDVKTCRFDDSLTALKFVRRRER